MNKVKKLLEYQKRAVNSIYSYLKGIFAMITGSGKTLIQGHIIKEVSEIYNDEFGVYIYVTPTILLNYQATDEYKSHVFYPNKKNYSYHLVHSGDKTDEDDLAWLRFIYDVKFDEITPSTKEKVCLSKIENARLFNKPIIIGTTYKSLIKVSNACLKLNIKPKLIILDESKFAINQNIHDIINQINPERFYSFTPIEKYTKNKIGLGMQNVNFFGETIFEYDAQESIKNGTMVPPRIMIAHGETKQYTEEDLNKSIHKIIYETFKQLRKYFNIHHEKIK